VGIAGRTVIAPGLLDVCPPGRHTTLWAGGAIHVHDTPRVNDVHPWSATELGRVDMVLPTGAIPAAITSLGEPAVAG
jgi:hypothetical protein